MLKVLKAGIFTTIQDQGRIGYASFGIPISGAMDGYSSNLANHILNNALEDAVIEITLGGCEFQFLEKTFICISGGDFSPKINNRSIALNSRIQVHKDDILSFGKKKYGVRSYLAIKGGFLSEVKLGSRSFYQHVTENFILKKNELISYSPYPNTLASTFTSVKVDSAHFNTNHLKCYEGPEFDLLNHPQKEILFSKEFLISKDNNRMGYKLMETLDNKLPQILTSSVMPGTVQLTPSGKLIVLMKDCQVTGGYPRVLQLTKNAIHKMAQKTTSNSVKFKLQE